MNTHPAFNDTPMQSVIPPLKQQLTADPDAAKVWASVESDYLKLYNTPAQVGALMDDHYRQIVAIVADQTRTPAYIAQQKAGVRNTSGQTLEAIWQGAEAARKRIADACEAILISDTASGTAPSPTAGKMFQTDRDAALTRVAAEATVIELQTLQVWDDLRMILDAAPDSTQVQRTMEQLLRDAAEEDDALALRALWRSGRRYLRAHGMNLTAAQFRTLYIQQAAASLSPTQRAALQVERDVAKNYGHVAAAVQVARGYISDANKTLIANLIGWNDQPITIVGLSQALANIKAGR